MRVRLDFDPASGWGFVWRDAGFEGRVHQRVDGTGFVFYRGAFNLSEPGVARPTLPELLADIEDELGS